MPVWPLCRESELILLKKKGFRVGYLGLGVHMGKFSLWVAAISYEHTSFFKLNMSLSSTVFLGPMRHLGARGQ